MKETENKMAVRCRNFCGRVEFNSQNFLPFYIHLHYRLIEFPTNRMCKYAMALYTYIHQIIYTWWWYDRRQQNGASQNGDDFICNSAL